MSRLLQFLIRAYLPLAARHTLLDGAAHASRKAPAAATADGTAQPARVASMPRRPAPRDDGRRAASLAA